MPKTLTVTAHLSLSEIDEYIRTCRKPLEVRRWLVIRHALCNPSSSETIGQHLGLAPGSVRNLIRNYNRQGPGAIRKPDRENAPNAYLSKQEEKNFSQLPSTQ